MKKLLITLLLISTFCSGTAFAWDRYSTAMLEHDTAAIELIVDAAHNSSNDIHTSDHCAHGAAHLVGIFYNVSSPVIASVPNHQITTLVPLASLYISPLLRPPIV